MEEKKHLFSNREIWRLLIPLMVEQLLNCLMGMVDTMMVSNIGSAAISAVSLTDSINVLMVQALTALAAGGTIVCSQYLGRGSEREAQKSAEQLVFIVTAISLIIMAFCLIFRIPLLKLIFGQVEDAVMHDSQTYFLYTAISYPFIGLYNAGASVFRAEKNTRTPMTISVISNILNVVGNAWLIWGVGWGVKGAAIATLASRIFSAVFVMAFLRNKNLQICVRDYHRIRPDGGFIRRILNVGIPSAVENSMFQFGKLAVQSTVSTLGTAAIAAQAMTNMLEMLSGVCAMGVGTGMMTVVGQCIGAGREDEAVYYVKYLSVISEVVLVISCLAAFALVRPITVLGAMEAESARLCIQMVTAITVVKPLIWVLSFSPSYGMRAAGDVRFSMIVSVLSMWICRVSLCFVLCRFLGFGPMGVWIAMFSDWGIRAVLFGWRFHSRRWLRHKVI